MKTISFLDTSPQVCPSVYPSSFIITQDLLPALSRDGGEFLSSLGSTLRRHTEPLSVSFRQDLDQVEIASTTARKLLPTHFGYPAHFGPHCFLPEAEFRIVWRFLRCNRCSFRHLYHKLLLDENVRAGFAASHGPANNAQPLHSLTRAIKTILHGFALNKHLPSRLVIASSGSGAPHPISPDAYFTTVLQASFRFQRKFVVCPSHGRELFSFLYFEDDSDSVSSVELDSSLRTKIVPRGHSHFFQSCALHANDQTTDENDSKHVAFTPIRVFAVAAKGVLTTTLETHTYCNITPNTWCNPIPNESVLFSEKTCLSRLEEINHKWNLAYQSTEVEGQMVFAAANSNRFVRFPAPNVVSKVHNLITYATALRLERRNRIWELEAQHRLFDRYRRLLSEGHDPSAATELSQTFTEDEEEEITNCRTVYNSGTCSSPSGNNTECRSKKKRKRKRKRSSGTKSTNCIERNNCGSWTPVDPEPVTFTYQSTGTQMKMHV